VGVKEVDMSKLPMISVAATLAFASEPRAEAPDPMHVVNPSDFHWKPKEALPPGAFGAVLNGDPAHGSYDFVGRFPAAFTVPLHYHTNECSVLMLHGAMRISRPGSPDVAVSEGGFFLLPAKMAYVAHCDATCTFLVHGEKPFDIIYSDAKDDPRLAGASAR
jgi:hypothetical protein